MSASPITPITSLMLSRRPNETIDIGPDISITVKRVQGRRVQIRVTAPKNVRIMRREIGLQVQTNAFVPMRGGEPAA